MPIREHFLAWCTDLLPLPSLAEERGLHPRESWLRQSPNRCLNHFRVRVPCDLRSDEERCGHHLLPARKRSRGWPTVRMVSLPLGSSRSAPAALLRYKLFKAETASNCMTQSPRLAATVAWRLCASKSGSGHRHPDMGRPLVAPDGFV